MARNGSGVYTNPYPNFVAGTVISSTEVDANNAAMGTALTGSIAADGQTTITGNLPMATYKFTGLGAGSASTDSANLGQVQAGAYIWCGTMGGAADAGTLSPTPAITAYAAGQRFAWKASTNTNTGAMTIAISGLATIAAQSDRTALAAGDHVASDIYVGILDTTSTMQIMKFSGPTAGSIPISTLDIDGGTDIGEAIVDADLFVIDNGAGGTNRKTAASRIKTYVGTTRAIEFVIDGGGSAITTGVKGYLEIPFACTINRVTLLADQSGSIVVDVWKDTYANYPPVDADSITASAVPAISGATKDQDSTLTGWTTAISAGDILGFNVDSIATCQRVTISLKVTA